MSISTNIQSIRQLIPPTVQLVCVSKFNPNESILEAYEAGEKVFGESKVQELCDKHETLPQDVDWHFIGHLQTNKIKYIVPFVALIHGVDSYKLLVEINKQAQKTGRKVNCLLQIHIAQEETKFGFSPQELMEILKIGAWKELNSISICGLMGIATYTENQEQIRKEFGVLKTLFDKVKTDYFSEESSFKELSMGMSDDFQLAIEAGSTMVRVGSKIFGNRQYN